MSYMETGHSMIIADECAIDEDDEGFQTFKMNYATKSQVSSKISIVKNSNSQNKPIRTMTN